MLMQHALHTRYKQHRLSAWHTSHTSSIECARSSPFVDHGVNRCPTVGSVMHPGGWCNYKDKSFAETAWDTSMTAVLSGHFLSDDKTEIYLYKYGASMTHQGGHQPATWSNNTNGSLPNTGIELMTLRRDGFVSVDAPLIESPGFGHAGEFYRSALGLALKFHLQPLSLQIPRGGSSNTRRIVADLSTSIGG